MDLDIPTIVSARFRDIIDPYKYSVLERIITNLSKLDPSIQIKLTSIDFIGNAISLSVFYKGRGIEVCKSSITIGYSPLLKGYIHIDPRLHSAFYDIGNDARIINIFRDFLICRSYINIEFASAWKKNKTVPTCYVAKLPKEIILYILDYVYPKIPSFPARLLKTD